MKSKVMHRNYGSGDYGFGMPKKKEGEVAPVAPEPVAEEPKPKKKKKRKKK